MAYGIWTGIFLPLIEKASSSLKRQYPPSRLFIPLQKHFILKREEKCLSYFKGWKLSAFPVIHPGLKQNWFKMVQAMMCEIYFNPEFIRAFQVVIAQVIIITIIAREQHAITLNQQERGL